MERIRLLGVETSSPVFSVALCDGGHVVNSMRVTDARRPDAVLADMIQKVTTSAGLKLSGLDGFAISIGPGSFTGLRVGVTTVKTMAWALHKPVLPVSSLEVIAQNHLGSSHPISLFLDARKGKVYTALFGSGDLKRLTDDQLMAPQDALKKMPEDALLVGDGLQRYEELVVSGGGRWEIAPASTWIPSAEHLCRLAISRWPRGRVDDPHTLVPEYLYSKESDITGR